MPDTPKSPPRQKKPTPAKPRRRPHRAANARPPWLDLLEEAQTACAPGLPIAQSWATLVETLRAHRAVIVTGETGSGKSTQLPKICLEAGLGRHGLIVCTQPRRIAAITVSNRLAEELGPHGRQLAGYKIRFQKHTGPATRLLYATDGLLLAEAQRDPRLSAYEVVIVDEAHERSLNVDFLLGLLKRLLPVRPDLRVIISSATINAAQFSEAFNDAPVVEVSGRGFPVEVRYRAPEPQGEDEDERTLADRVTEAIDEIKAEDRHADILVFLPTERDIQEATKTLRDLWKDQAEILPMYGRLAARDQRRIFEPCPRPKIVVATNVAETSLTVPGIKYVVDTGLARISKYNVRSRTKALPVSPISQASADQRAGRAGRVQAGVCLRLYDEADFKDRPLYTPPEILRANLAEVILRLAALNLGSVSEFPFLDPPQPAAVKEGLGTLRELGALDGAAQLTPRGRLMAKLPLDPRISRMLIQARKENALREMIVIAAAMSIQDPKERPAGKEALADQAHARFADPKSDFVAFLNLWNAYHRKLDEGTSRNQMRRFCHETFLSFNRMTEWRDIHDQILDILNEAGGFHVNPNPAGYEAIHRSILAGFLGQIGLQKEGPQYLSTRGRAVTLFPGSGLYKKRPRWIVAAEFVRTSQLFARTAAEILPQWVEALAREQCTYQYAEPHWEKARGHVVAQEKVSYLGLPLMEGRPRDFGRIAPEEAREIFIREGLMPGALKGRFPFLDHNVAVIAEVQSLEDKTRRRDITVGEGILYDFYDAALERLEGAVAGEEEAQGHEGGPVAICDERGLEKALGMVEQDAWLRLKKAQLLQARPEADELSLFPGHIHIAGHRLPLSYRFAPGDEKDGVSVRIPLGLAGVLPAPAFDWLIPGLLGEKIEALLKGLPKQLRKTLVPIPETARRIHRRLTPSESGLLGALEKVLREAFGLRVDRSSWPPAGDLPRHLLMRFELVDARGKVLAHGRDLDSLRKSTIETASAIADDDPAWLKAKALHEKAGVRLEDLPVEMPRVRVQGSEGRQSIEAFLGLAATDQGVDLRLFWDGREALEKSCEGARRLLAMELAKELRYLEKHCLPGGIPADQLAAFGGPRHLRENILAYLSERLLGCWDQIPGGAALQKRAERLKRTLYADALPIIDALKEVLAARAEAAEEIRRSRPGSVRILASHPMAPAFSAEILRLVPPNFPLGCPAERLPHLPRYLRALALRVQRAYADPAKELAKGKRIAPFLSGLEEARQKIRADAGKGAAEALTAFDGLVEEYRVSIFAPELGTACPVSDKRLRTAWEELRARF